MTAFAPNEYEIIRACGYIKDDNYLASYYGVSIYGIRRMREKAEARNKNRSENRAFRNSGELIDIRNCEISNRAMMEAGSRKLLEGIYHYLKQREISRAVKS